MCLRLFCFELRKAQKSHSAHVAFINIVLSCICNLYESPRASRPQHFSTEQHFLTCWRSKTPISRRIIMQQRTIFYTCCSNNVKSNKSIKTSGRSMNNSFDSKGHKRFPIIPSTKPKSKTNNDQAWDQIDDVHEVIEHDWSFDSTEKDHHHE